MLKKMVAEETSTLKEAYKELIKLLNTDERTGLASRRYLKEKIEQERQRFGRFGRPFSLVLLDFDDFKKINDRYGHAVGDQVLRQAAKAIQTPLRETDLIGRWGGDEFVLLLPASNAQEAAVLTARVQERLHQKNWPFDMDVSFSAGIGQILSQKTPEKLFARIDKALYAAKKYGKDQGVPCHIVTLSSFFGSPSLAPPPQKVNEERNRC